jgi:hypothetical protein
VKRLLRVDRRTAGRARWLPRVIALALALGIWSAVPAAASGATYYVDTASIGGPCSDSYTTAQANTITTPWCTLDRAASAVVGGDTVQVRAGTYAALIRNWFAPSSMVTFAGYQSERPVVMGLAMGLQGGTLSQNFSFQFMKFTGGVDYVNFANADFSHNEIAISPATSNCDPSTQVCASNGFHAGPPGSNLTFSNNYVHNADIAFLTNQPGAYTPFQNFTIEDNVFADNGGVVMHINGSQNWLVKGNEFADNGIYSGIDQHVHPDAIHIVDSGDSLMFDSNYVHATSGVTNASGTLTAGRGFLFEPNPGGCSTTCFQQTNVTLQNNVITGDSNDFGIRLTGQVPGVRVINNTIWMNATGGRSNLHFASDAVGNAVVENNILRSFYVESSAETFTPEDYNVIVNRVSGAFTPAAGSHDLSSAPSFLAPTAPTWNLRLQPGSPGVDAADSTVAPTLDADRNTRVTSSDPVPDMGAFELAHASSPAVVTGSASGVTQTGATLNGTVNPEGQATTYYFEYGTTTSYGSTTSTGSLGADSTDDQVSAAVSGLQSSTTYDFRLVATNTTGTTYGGNQTFTTAASPPSATTDAATGMGPTAATLNGHVNPQGVATTYHFDYGTTTSYGTSVPVPEGSAGSDRNDHAVSYSLTGLASSTTYHYRVVATNSAGTTNGADSTFTTPAAASYSSVVIGDGPVSYWKLRETSGTSAPDSVGTHPGTYTGGFTQKVPGPLSGDPGVLLNGTSGFVSVPYSAALNPSQWSAEGWFYTTAFNASDSMSVINSRLPSTAGKKGYDMGLTSTGRPYVTVGDGSASHDVIAASAVSVNAWHHEVATYDGTSVRLYLDGQLIGGPTPYGYTPQTTDPLAIGSMNTGANGQYFPGVVAHAAVYNKALTATQIQTHYSTGAAGFTTPSASSYSSRVVGDGPVSYWKLRETSGTVAPDSVGSHPGTYAGGFTQKAPGALSGDPGVLLNGTTGFVSVPYSAALNPALWTAEAWIYTTAFNASDSMSVINSRWTTGSLKRGYDMGLAFATGCPYVTIGDGSTYHDVIAPTPPSLNAWHHEVATYDGTSVRLYLDGQLVAGPTAYGYSPQTTTPLAIGSMNTGANGQFFSGEIAHAAVYNKALTASQVASHFGG